MKLALCAMGIGLAAVVALDAQAPARFGVVSIKPSAPDEVRATRIGDDPGGGFTMINLPVNALILSAYPSATEVIGTPSWTLGDPYTVVARAERELSRDERYAALQSLLAERLAFRGRLERVERPVYGLVVARADGRLGPQLRRYTGDCAALRTAAAGSRTIDVPAPENGAPACGMMFGGDRILAGGIAMPMLALNITQAAGRVVLDKTNLDGLYAFTLSYTQRPGPSTTGSPDGPPSIFTALQEQLGLKLEPQRGLVDVLFVDHIERPTAD